MTRQQASIKKKKRENKYSVNTKLNVKKRKSEKSTTRMMVLGEGNGVKFILARCACDGNKLRLHIFL